MQLCSRIEEYDRKGMNSECPDGDLNCLLLGNESDALSLR